MLRRVPPKDVEVPRACAWGSTKGEDDLFGRDMVSCGGPLLERGDGGI